jgi:cysteine synthase
MKAAIQKAMIFRQNRRFCNPQQYENPQSEIHKKTTGGRDLARYRRKSGHFVAGLEQVELTVEWVRP